MSRLMLNTENKPIKSIMLLTQSSAYCINMQQHVLKLTVILFVWSAGSSQTQAVWLFFFPVNFMRLGGVASENR